MLIQPKPYMDKLKLRHHAYGTERRRNMSKLILEHGHALLDSIDNVISALQEYSLAHEMFNEAVRQNCDMKEKFKQNLNKDEE